MLQNKFKDTKGVIRSDNLKKDRQYNNQMNKDKNDKNDHKNTAQKTNDWPTRTPINMAVNSEGYFTTCIQYFPFVSFLTNLSKKTIDLYDLCILRQ